MSGTWEEMRKLETSILATWEKIAMVLAILEEEKVSPISEIPTHHNNLVFQSNEGMTPVLIKLSQLGGLKFLRN